MEKGKILQLNHDVQIGYKRFLRKGRKLMVYRNSGPMEDVYLIKMSKCGFHTLTERPGNMVAISQKHLIEALKVGKFTLIN